MWANIGAIVVRGIVVCGCFLGSIAAHAWGYDGHRITADIAMSLLSREAKIRVGELLQGNSLADVASYLDEERAQLKRLIPGSDHWHYDNIPVCGNADASAFCSSGDCASARIRQFEVVLADSKTERDTRVFALKALVHLIGDIHQPLHAADNNDHGGNDVAVGKHNLHGEWDSGIVKRLTRHTTVSEYAMRLLTQYPDILRSAQRGNAGDWAAEAHEVAVRVAYQEAPGFSCGKPMAITRLPESYYANAMPAAEKQLVRAGARIAFVLNRVFGK